MDATAVSSYGLTCSLLKGYERHPAKLFRMSDIFISYARADKSSAEDLAQALEQHGWSVWWDPHIRVGTRFDQIIKKELDAAKCVVVLWSSASILSEWVKDEAAEAIRRGILVPVMLEDVEIPFGFGFRRIHSARLVDWNGSTDESEFIRLLEDLSEMMKSTPVKKTALQQVSKRKWRLAVALAACAIVLSVFGIYVVGKWKAKSSAPAQASTQSDTNMHSVVGNPKPVACDKLYQQMTDNERIALIDDRVRRISLAIAKREYKIPPLSRMYIKKYVDMYASRVNNGAKERWREDLKLVLARGKNYAPIINLVFKSYDVSPMIGLYIPMIETEFHDCLQAPSGPLGLYQFTAATARRYGVDPADRCKVDKVTPAAARHIKDNMSYFASERMSVALSIVSYNHGSEMVQRYMNEVVVLSDEESEQRFWELFTGEDPADGLNNASESYPIVFGQTTSGYIYAFFAAAIVGEFPECFGLDTKPLSSYERY
jgi:hypothetical protein